jgi:hypothetical protein
MIRSYIDLDLWIEKHRLGEGYSVHASLGKKVESGEFESPLAQQELDGLRDAVATRYRRDTRLGAGKPVLVRDLGRKLYQNVFAGPLRALLAGCMPGRLSTRGVRLRLRSTSPEVLRWPWELLHNGRRFLALSLGTPIVRDLEYSGDVVEALRTAHPLRLLVVVASPSGYTPLNAKGELEEIRKALRWPRLLSMVKVEKLVKPTLESLDQMLAQKSFHVVHFIGHGTFDNGRNRGVLLFEDEEGHADPVTGERLAAVLEGHESLRLMVLNSCDGACSSGESVFAGVAQSIINQPVPAVVAMQLPISDPIAITFSYWFYWALARGRPVDWAITRARKAMRAAAQGFEWAIPVLFLSTPDGQLFRWKPSPSLYTSLTLVGLLCAGFLTWSWKLASAPPPPAPPLSVSCPSPRALPDMKFVLVHGGSFQMGSDSGEKDEKPVHQVTISRPFCLGAYEVTQEQVQTIMGFKGTRGLKQEADMPAQGISYPDTLDFIHKLDDREDKPVFRLPREAEWEFAAQDPGALNCDTDRRMPVGSLKPNRYGLHGMLGNVWEWVEDWYGEYPAEPVTDPSGPATGEKRIRRGGSSDSAISNCRASQRKASNPAWHQQNTGFRILREIHK